jgi:hypothetical protein
MGRVLVFSGRTSAARDELHLASALDPHGLIAPAALYHVCVGYSPDERPAVRDHVSEHNFKSL